ncbi:MAG: 4Fe-4S binding protein [Bauldia sp.]|nr:4Fe-4S binding protein [Bauldia sp.]
MAAFASAWAGSSVAQERPSLAERVTPEVLHEVFPAADRIEEVAGNPPLARAYAGDQAVGYVFSTFDVVRAPSYSPRPFDAIVGIDLAGRLTGAEVISFYDPYLTGFPTRVARLAEFLGAHVGYPVRSADALPLPADFVAGTTISARAIRAGILDAGRVVMNAMDPRPVVTEPTLDRDGFRWLTWDELLASGAVTHGAVSYGDVRALFAGMGVTPVAMDVPLDAGITDETLYSELFVALATPALVGRNVLGSDLFARHVSPTPPGTITLALLSRGRYNFRGLAYLREDNGHLFDRIRLVQGDLELTFHADQHVRMGPVTRQDGGPTLFETSAFSIPPESGFDPLQPFQVVLLIHAAAATGEMVTVELPVAYQVPAEAILLPFVEPPPAWVEAWRLATAEVIILSVALAILTSLFAFQGRLVRSRRLYRWVRNGFLAFTLVWLGWIAGGQLSIVHIINYIKAPFDGAALTYYLAEPLIIIIAVYVLLSLVLIGRGVFCGWLCPFGALQELTAKVARALRLPVWNPTERLQRLMWLPKFATAAVILGTAFVAPAALASAEEIEPFKTAITSVFTRPWPYVAYAVLLIGLGLVTERFFCRFLCPLGGILALGDRLHIFTSLKRRPECGSGGCHLCERSCPVKAIERSGRIVMSECFQCLDCQVEYYDDGRCPPLARARKNRERAVPVIGRHAPAAVALSDRAAAGASGGGP